MSRAPEAPGSLGTTDKKVVSNVVSKVVSRFVSRPNVVSKVVSRFVLRPVVVSKVVSRVVSRPIVVLKVVCRRHGYNCLASSEKTNHSIADNLVHKNMKVQRYNPKF